METIEVTCVRMTIRTCVIVLYLIDVLLLIASRNTIVLVSTLVLLYCCLRVKDVKHTVKMIFMPDKLELGYPTKSDGQYYYSTDTAYMDDISRTTWNKRNHTLQLHGDIQHMKYPENSIELKKNSTLSLRLASPDDYTKVAILIAKYYNITI